MLVTLIGKNVLYKLKLPTKKTGNYWITDDDGKKLINIVGKFNIGIDPVNMTVQSFTYTCTTYCNAKGVYSASWR